MQNCKKKLWSGIFPTWKFPFLIQAKSTLQNFSSSVCNKKIFIQKICLVFKIDAINGKKWVKFVAMQQDHATLIHNLNTMKGT